jgi:hypothetical protein
MAEQGLLKLLQAARVALGGRDAEETGRPADQWSTS